MKSKGLFTNIAEDLATGLLVAIVVLLVIFASLKLLANATEPLRDFSANTERQEIDLGEQHIFP